MQYSNIFVSCLQIVSKFFHFLFLFGGAEEKFHLISGSHIVVLGIRDFVVDVSIYIVAQKFDALHKGEESGGVWQVLNFNEEQKLLGDLFYLKGRCYLP